MYKNRNNRKELSLENIIYGRNSVLELLKAGKRSVNKLMVSQTARGSGVTEPLAVCDI